MAKFKWPSMPSLKLPSMPKAASPPKPKAAPGTTPPKAADKDVDGKDVDADGKGSKGAAAAVGAVGGILGLGGVLMYLGGNATSPLPSESEEEVYDTNSAESAEEDLNISETRCVDRCVTGESVGVGCDFGCEPGDETCCIQSCEGEGSSCGGDVGQVGEVFIGAAGMVGGVQNAIIIAMLIFIIAASWKRLA
jgi:hypothetical protein